MSTTLADRPAFKSKAPSTPARQALAHAHADLKIAQATLDALEAALASGGGAFKAFVAADDALETAVAALVRVQREHTDALINPAIKPTMTMQAARQKVEDAKIALADAQATRTALQERRHATELERNRVRQNVENAAITVLRDHWAGKINRFLEELAELHHQIVARGQLLECLVVNGIIPGQGPNAPEGVIELNSRYSGTPPASWPFAYRALPPKAALDEALAALKSDPNAKVLD